MARFGLRPYTPKHGGTSIMGQGWRVRGQGRPAWTPGHPLRRLGIAVCFGSLFLLMTTGCRTPECDACRSGGPGRLISSTSPPAVGLPGTPTLPPGPASASTPSASTPRSSDSRLSSGTVPASPASATRRVPVSPGSASGGSAVMPANGSALQLPPPQDLSSPPGGSPPSGTPSSAMSNWAPATPLSPAPVGLGDPGPLPPPPPGATSNMPVLPPTPPPGLPQ